MKKFLLVVLTLLFVSSIMFADKVVAPDKVLNPEQGLRDGLREQGDTCEDPFFAVVGENTAPYAPVWYEYTATMDGEATVTSCIDGQSIDTDLYVYSDCAGTLIAESDDAYCPEYSYASQVVYEIEAGVSYYIYWDDYWTAAGFIWTITEDEASIPELGDTCEEAIPYYNINDPAVYSATIAAYDVEWYELNLDDTYLNVEVSLEGSSFDTMMEVWDECDGTMIASNDDYYGTQSAVLWDMLVEGNYFVKVLGYSAYYGDFIINCTGTGANMEPGDIIANAIPVVLDGFDYFNDFGDLTPYADDYDLPYGDGADVVYELNLAIGGTVDVLLLNSDFDTKMAVYAAGVLPGEDNYLYYNDDDPLTRENGDDLSNWTIIEEPSKTNNRALQSALRDMPLDAGTYYIVIDGYNGEIGNWDIEVTWEDGCQELECTGTPEGEPMLNDDELDVTNGGCNADPVAWGQIADEETVCGMLNTYIFEGSNYRDTDWYLFDTGTEFDSYDVNVTVDCDFGDVIIFLLTNADCAALEYVSVDDVGYCSVEELDGVVGQGTFGIMVSTPVFVGYEEGFNYALTLDIGGYELPAGSTCGAPYVIDALPFVETGMTTEGFGNDYSSTDACLSYYMNGDDFVFAYTPESNMSVNIALTNTLTYTGLFVIQGFVDDPNAVCIDMSTVYAGNPFLEDVILPLGETYYIVVSTWPAPYFTPFDIAITANEPPTFGSLDGTVTALDGGAAIEGATVSAGGFSEITDATGYYMFAGLETGFYDVSVMADGYYGAAEMGVEILENQTTTVDFALDVFSDIGDTILDPIVIDAFPYFMSGDISLYTDYSTGAGLEGSRAGQDIFYEFTVTEPSVMDLHSCGSEFDTYMHLYDSAYTRIAYDDDGCSTWGSGSTMASWINDGNGFLVQPGTYYICNEGYSFVAGYRYFESHFDILPPPPMGSIDGTVTDLVTGEPIIGANVTIAGTTLMTDDMGYYLFGGLELGLYDIAVSLTGYNPDGATGVEVLEDQTTTVDFALDPLVGVIFELTCDSWGYEATWNVWDVANSELVWAADWTFPGNNMTMTVSEDLPDGSYIVYVHDTYGDGGTSGIVSKQGVVLVEWLGGDYGYEGEFPFILGPILFGGLEGTVTDNFTGDPIDGATIMCGGYSGMTDATGYYNIPDVLVGTYIVTCDAAGYTGQEALDVVIAEDVVTTQDFGLDIIMEPATNLVATVDGYDVGLAWTEPYVPATDILHWDDMVNFDAIGLTGGGSFYVAIRFTPTELAPFDGLVMDNVTAYVRDLPTAMTLYVWSGANAANILVQQTVTPVGLEWNNFVLNTPVVIDASDELWIGYYTESVAGAEFTSGCDAGPAVAEYGDLLSMDGAAWESMSIAYGLDYNWNIWGGIAGEPGRNQVLARPQTWHPEAIQVDERIEFATAGYGEAARPFTGSYNVYRNDVVIATVGETMYDDLGVAAGMYEYYVTAVYDEGESPETNHVIVEIGMADVSVDPTVLSETLDYGLTSDHNILLSNDGDANFYWAGSVNDVVRFDVPEMKPRPAGKTNNGADMDSDLMMFEVPETRDMWDLLDTFQTEVVSQAGIEFDGTYYYTAVWSSDVINKFDIDGTFIESFSIPGVSGLRDLAYDGEYFYGGAAGTTLWQMDFENQTLVSTITSAVAVRAIAYDDESDGFWVNNWSTDITLVGRDGSIMDSFLCSATNNSLYGLAYDNYTDGGPYVYGFSQAGSGCVISQYSIATGAETGVMHDVLLDVGLVGDIAGGMFTSADLIPGTFVIGTLNQNSYIVAIYELCPASTWLDIEPTSGTLAPGESVNITATFNAIELPGLTYFADIVFTDGEATATVAADLTITGSIPTAEITVDPLEFDVMVPVDGLAEYTLNIGNLGDLDLEYDAEIMYYEGRSVVEAYPQSADYWTGTFNAASYTQTSAINLVNLEDGWMMFDVSGIPGGAVINSIEANVYVSDTYYPWWSITPCTLDPLTTPAATLATHIIGNEGTTLAYSYNNESSAFLPGWYTYPLGGTAIADLEASLGQDWFACGLTSRDNSTTYYVYIDGWNEANPPSLTIDYTVPINPWVTFDGDMTVGGMVPAGGGNDVYTLNFDATGLMDGDVMMGEIVIGSNDLYNEVVIVPVTMTVGAAYMYGDVTGDDVVDAFDAANVLQFTVGMDPVGAPLPWTWELIAGDVDGNGDPEAYDAALILQYAVGMIDIFPIEARIDAPVADVSMTVENGELVFSTTGDLYGFSVMTETELISFQAPVTEYLHAVNGNAIALASAEAISGEFLRIPYEKIAESGEFTMTMTVNGISSENTYYVEDLEVAPVVNAVLSNYPNPYNPNLSRGNGITISLSVANNNTPVTVSIYNVKGQLVNSLVNETVASGIHDFVWSGKDKSNRLVSSGIYFYKVKIGELNETHKMIMLK